MSNLKRVLVLTLVLMLSVGGGTHLLNPEAR